MLDSSVQEMTLALLFYFFLILLIGEFHQEFQPEPSLLSDNDNSGEERDHFLHETDVLHPGFRNCVKARFCISQCFYSFSSIQF